MHGDHTARQWPIVALGLALYAAATIVFEMVTR